MFFEIKFQVISEYILIDRNYNNLNIRFNNFFLEFYFRIKNKN